MVGIGRIVQGTIAPAMMAETECELVAATSRDRDRAARFVAKFDVRHAYTRYEQMLAAPDAHRRAVAAFTSAVLRGEQPNPSGLDGVRSAQVCAAIALSAREVRLVEVVDWLPGC